MRALVCTHKQRSNDAVRVVAPRFAFMLALSSCIPPWYYIYQLAKLWKSTRRGSTRKPGFKLAIVAPWAGRRPGTNPE